MNLSTQLHSWPMRKSIILIWHCLGIFVTYYLAFLLRFDKELPDYVEIFFISYPILMVCSVICFFLLQQFTGIWKYYSIDDLFKTISACVITMVIFTLIIKKDLLGLNLEMSRMVLGLEFILLTGWSTASRAGVRFIRERRRKRILQSNEYKQNVLICGALDEADLFIRACSQDFQGLFCGIISDDLISHKRYIHGVQVHPKKLEDIGYIVKTYDITNIHILSPFNKPVETNTIIDSCAKAGVSPHFHTLPALGELAMGDISVSMIRKVDVSDLLGRVQANLDRNSIADSIADKKVMVTGAGGSIGSELCRQILNYKPRALILFESSELALYKIEKELLESLTSIPIISIAGDVRIKEDIRQAIKQLDGVDLIYHTAAYKHVPLMEKNISAAFRNNVLGTAVLADTAEEMGVKRFIMISSDKAVRPSNIMGATKRIAERYIQEREFKGTEFVAVRFGNVLDSSGSVIPLFKRLIKEGKALTVTSPDMCRFFMTIPEAVDLVLMSGAVAHSSQIMVLEMGKPVKIYDLAVRLIELSGLKPHIDVKIEFCGLRPGEKEYEEILTEDENVIETDYDRIWLMQKDESKRLYEQVDLDLIQQYIQANEKIALRHLAQKYVPENTFTNGRDI